MNILIVSHYIPPHMSVASLRIYKMAKYLKQNGHEIKILTTKKYNFDGEQNNPQDMNGIEIIEVPYAPFKYFDRFKVEISSNPSKENTNPSTKVDDSFVQKLKRQVRKFRKIMGSLLDIHDLWIYPARNEGVKLYESWKYDIVISSFGPPASHMVASKLKKVHSDIFLIADFRDLWSQNFNAAARFPFSFIEGYLEKSSIKNADYLTTVSYPAKDKLQENFPTKNIEVLYNGYDTFRKNVIKKNKEEITIIYTGYVYEKQDPKKLFDTIQNLKSSKKITVNFYGDVNDDCKKLMNHYSFVNFHGKLPREEIMKLQEKADILLLLEWMDISQQGVMTGKLFEYLELKKPILSVGDFRNAPANVIEEVGIGKFCSTHEEIVSFIENFDTYKADEKALYEYSFARQIEKLEKIFNEIL